MKRRDPFEPPIPANSTHATRRGVLKWLAVTCGAVVGAQALSAPVFAAVIDDEMTIAELIREIEATTPEGHANLQITIRRNKPIDAACFDASGRIRHRNPNNGEWV